MLNSSSRAQKCQEGRTEILLLQKSRGWWSGTSLAILRQFDFRGSLLTGLAAAVSFGLPHALGLPEAFWGAITAIAVIQSELAATRSAARTQFTGAAVGGAIGLVTILVFGRTVFAFGPAIMIAMVSCVALRAANTGRTAGITCTIVMLVPPVGSLERMFAARLVEVAWGISVAVTLAWIVGRFSTARVPSTI